jgi:hypothetical protein
MSRNGSGTYSLPAGNPVVPSTTISTTWANTTLTDIASALTGSVASDGQTPMSSSLNMANNKIVSVLDPTNPQDAATKAYVDTVGFTVAPSTAGNVLTSNGTIWTSAAPTIPSGTVMLFYQAAAPTGWTKVTTQNDKALRVVSGTGGVTGGTTAFSTVFTNQTVTTTVSGTSGATTLSTAEIPSHTHTANYDQTGSGGGGLGPDSLGGSGFITNATGGGGSHTHSFSGSGTSSSVTLNVQYIDVIIASKN